MSKSSRYPSYADCVAQVLSESTEPLALETLIAHVEQRRPMTKSGRAAIVRAVEHLYQAVPVAHARYGWLSSLLSGSTIRHPLQGDEVRRGYLLLDELEHAVFFPQFFQDQQPEERGIWIELLGGPVIEATAYIEQQTWSLRLGQEFVDWVDQQGGMGKDDIVIQVIDGSKGRYLLRLQPRESRDEATIALRNQEIAQAAEEIVREGILQRRTVFTWELVSRLIGRDLYKHPTPPDDLHGVLRTHSALRLVEGIGYQVEFAQPTQNEERKPSKRQPSLRKHESLSDRNMEQLWLEVFGPGWNEMTEVMSAMNLFDDASEGDACEAYADYLVEFEQANRPGDPLDHDDYHLLEAELEALVDLELDFGYLLPDQLERKRDLSERLFIDPDTLVNEDGGWDDADDFDGSPNWN